MATTTTTTTTTGGALCQYDSSDVSCQSGDGAGGGAHGEASSLHERFVAYVHALAHGSRRGVWGEHSYARSRIGGAARAGRVRALLAPRAHSPPPVDVDVVGLGELPPEPPGVGACDPTAALPALQDDDDAVEDDWEARVTSLAPSAAHARLAAAAGDALRALTLERLAGGAGAGGEESREQARAAARRLRRALALAAGAGRPPAPAWLHGALTSVLPRATRRLYEEAVAELRGSAPRLAERLTGAWAPPPVLPPAAAGGAVGPEAAPWLVWVASGRGSLDARWERRLAALLHTRVLRPLAAESAAPATWCAAAAARVRDQLTDALADAGERSVILGGVGAGAALAGTLARGAGGVGGGAGGVRGCALLAPPLLSAEGAAAAEALAGVRLPLLVVAGGGAGAGSARALAGRGRRLLEVRGADAELRVPRALRRRLRLPQGALDAALAEELARWAMDAAERGEDPPQEEYAHLPPAAPTPPPPPLAPCRSIEVVEGRVVSRCAGGTPLPLALPQRRESPASAPPAAATPLHAADIMQLPVVFADDTGAGTGTDSSGGGGSPVTVTSGGARGGAGGAPPSAAGAGVKLTRVILASRGAGASESGPRPARRVLLRRPLRVLAPPPGKEPARPPPPSTTAPTEH